MLQLLMLLLIVQPSPVPTSPQVETRDRALGPTPVTDKDLHPMKAPDCRTEAETRRAVEQVNRGEAGECFVRDIRRLSRR